MSWIEIIADRKIRDAQEEGAFDDLPGKGKPLKLEFDPRIPPEQRAAYRLMKEAQLLPDWIQLDKEVRLREEQWRARVEEFARGREPDHGASDQHRRRSDESLDLEREVFLTAAAEQLRALNREIDRFNLVVPVPSRARGRINIPARMEELETRFPRRLPYPAGHEPSWRYVVEEVRPPTRLQNRMPLRRKRGGLG